MPKYAAAAPADRSSAPFILLSEKPKSTAVKQRKKADPLRNRKGSAVFFATATAA